MIPIRNKTDACSPISSNCIIWQGPDIPCIELCKGDTISDVVGQLALQLCELVEQTVELNPDLSGLDLACILPVGGAPETLVETLQLIIDKICLTTEPGRLVSVGLPECLQYTANGSLVTALPINDYVLLLANKICDILESIDIINSQILDLTTRVITLENCVLPCDNSAQDIIVVPSCLLPSVNTPASDLLLELEAVFCSLRTATGTPAQIINAVSSQCITGSQTILSGLGTYSSLSGWSNTPSTLAESTKNLWLVVCDMYQAIKDIQLNCCPGACDSVTFGYTTTVNYDSSNIATSINFNFTTSSIPVGFTDPTGFSKITLQDANGLQAQQVVSVASLQSNPSGINVSLGTLNKFAPIDVSVLFKVTDGTSACEDGQDSVVTLDIPCPTFTATPNATTIDVNFTNVLGLGASYQIFAVNGTNIFSNTVTNQGSTVNSTITGLTASTAYTVYIITTIDGVSKTCPSQTITTTTGIPTCPDRRIVFQICNSNSVTDDNFDIMLNNTLIGSVDLSQNAQVGSVFIADLNSAITIAGSDFVCPVSGMVQYNFDPALLQATNTIQMINTQDNGSGNMGSIGVRNYSLAGLSLSNPCVVTDISYGMPGGQAGTFTFNYTQCCS